MSLRSIKKAGPTPCLFTFIRVHSAVNQNPLASLLRIFFAVTPFISAVTRFVTPYQEKPFSAHARAWKGLGSAAPTDTYNTN